MQIRHALTLIVTMASTGLAQASDRDTNVKRTSQELRGIADVIHKTLFNGIRLSAAKDSTAQEVIRSSVQRREEIKGPAFVEQATALVRARDAQLRQLLEDDDDRSKFDANASVRLLIVERMFRSPYSVEPPAQVKPNDTSLERRAANAVFP